MSSQASHPPHQPQFPVATTTLPSASTLTKADLVELLLNHLGLNKREAKEIVEAFFELMIDALENDENVKLSGFGNFQLRDKRQRPGRNLKTGEVISIAARRIVTFYASQKLKMRVETGLHASG